MEMQEHYDEFFEVGTMYFVADDKMIARGGSYISPCIMQEVEGIPPFYTSLTHTSPHNPKYQTLICFPFFILPGGLHRNGREVRRGGGDERL